MPEELDPARQKAKEAEAQGQYQREHGASTSSSYSQDIDGPLYEEKLPYPKSVFFIVSNEFCERFSYYGMRTILSLYLVFVLNYSEPEAKVLYHLFTMFVYFFPVFGAIIADSWLGKFKTIFYLSCIYAIGNVVLSLAATGPLELPQREISILGLMLIAIGTGGIKPCVSAFGGDQFKLPQQQDQLAKFFSIFYFAINAGSLISTLLTPILREDVHCFGQESCFPVAFGVPGVLMIISIVVFVAGKSKYIIKEPQGNVIVRVSKCIGHALKNKIKNRDNQKEHWLDHAEDTYDAGLIADIKATLKVLWLYLPIPVFWALFDQQGTGWTFQATRMSGDIGVTTILPDQMQVVNPILILAFIPLFDTLIYPLLGRCSLLKTPLQRLTVGGLLAAVAFVMSGVLELQLQSTYPVLPNDGEVQVRIYNSVNCSFTIDGDLKSSDPLTYMSQFEDKNLKVTGDNQTFNYILTPGPDCRQQQNIQHSFTVSEKDIRGQIIKLGLSNEILITDFKDDVQKSSNGYPLVRTMVNTKNNETYNLIYKASDGTEKINSDTSMIENLEKLTPDTYKVYINYTSVGEVTVELGGVYAVLIDFTETKPRIQGFTISQPNSIHILWLIPQYLVITMGEIMFSVTGLEFSYSQAPVSMKSVLQAGWLLTTAFGNLLVVIIEEAKAFDDQALIYFLYAGLMVLDMIVFALMAMRYKYVVKPEDSSKNETEVSNDEIDEQSEKKGIENKSYKHDDVL